MTKTPEAKIELSKLIKENGKHGGFDYSVEEADVPKLQLFNDTINNYWIHDRKIFYIKINNKSFVLVQLIVDANNQGNVDILFNILNKNNKLMGLSKIQDVDFMELINDKHVFTKAPSKGGRRHTKRHIRRHKSKTHRRRY